MKRWRRLGDVGSDSEVKAPPDWVPSVALESEKSGIIRGRKEKRKRGEIGMDQRGGKRAIHGDGYGIQVPLEAT